MIEYCKLVKHILPSTITIVGGIHVQYNPTRFFQVGIDYVLKTFDIYKIETLSELDISRKTLEQITGICFKDEHGIWHENKSEPFNINTLPWPNRSYFYNHLDRYRYLELQPIAQVRGSYSCAFSCEFCYRHTLNNSRYSARDIKDIVDEIEQIQVDHIYFIDDDFLVSPSRVKTFIQLVKEKGIKKNYVCYARVDFIVRHKDLVKELKEIGFYYLLVGLETISDSYLVNYHKNTKMQMNEECVSFLNDIGIHIMGLFIIDLDFKKQDFKMMKKWIIDHQLKHVAFSLFTPEFGLPIFNKYQSRLLTTNPEHWDYLHLVAKPTHLSVKRFKYYYYTLLISMLFRAKRDGIYDFLDYNDYIKTFFSKLLSRDKYES